MSNKLPFVSSQIPKDLRTFLDRVRETLFGPGVERAVTIKDLVDAGIVGVTPSGTVTSPAGVIGTPPTPTNLTASGALANIILTWDAPAYNGHAYAEIWSAANNELNEAVLIALAPGSIYSDNVGSSATRYYWVRFVNVNGTAGKFSSANGVSGETGDDPEYLIEVLSDAYGTTSLAPFFQIDEPTEINGVTIPAGTYIKQAFIADATINNAKIQNLAVDNAKISSVAVSKLTAGSIAADQYIESSNYVADTQGFRINANGTAEFNNVVARGTVFATDGEFTGTVKAGTTILGGSAASYSTGTGLFAGTDASVYKFRVGTTTGARLQWDGSTIYTQNADATKVINMGATGTSAAIKFGTQFQVTGAGAATFSGVTTGTLNVKSATTGARTEITNSVIKVFDSTGTLRVKIGDLS